MHSFTAEERLRAIQKAAWQIGARYAELKAEIINRTPPRYFVYQTFTEMVPFERMLDRNVAHEMAILDDMCRTEIAWLKRGNEKLFQ